MFIEEMETTRDQFARIIKKYWDDQDFEISLINTIHYNVDGEDVTENKRFIIEIQCSNKVKHSEMMRFCKIIGVDLSALETRRDKFYQ